MNPWEVVLNLGIDFALYSFGCFFLALAVTEAINIWRRL